MAARPQFVAKIGVIRSGGGAEGSRCHFASSGFAERAGDIYRRSRSRPPLEYTFNVTDRANVKRLRELVGEGSFRDAALDNPFTVPISSITHADPKTHHADQYDLHCKVLEVITAPETGRTTLVVWDGSDSRPFRRTSPTSGRRGGWSRSRAKRVGKVSPFGGRRVPAFSSPLSNQSAR